MTFDPTVLLDLWTRPHRDASQAAGAFRERYADSVRVNGTLLSVDELVQRAQGLQQAFADLEREVLEVCDGGTKVVLAFRLSGWHVGPLSTSAGVLPPTGRRISLRVIDVLTLVDGKIATITMVADELGALAAVRAAALVD